MMSAGVRVVVCLLCALSCSACMGMESRESRRKIDPYVDHNSSFHNSSGRRVVFRDAHGAPVAKWRWRRGAHVKVYDSKMRPLGSVRRVKDAQILFQVAPLKGEPFDVRALEPGRFEVGELSIERRDDSWLIFDARRLLLGVISIDASQGVASFREALEPTEPMLSTREGDRGLELVDAKGEVVYRGGVSTSKDALVTFALSGPTELERAALALFFEHDSAAATKQLPAKEDK